MSINMTVTVKAPARLVYEALTQAHLLQEWFCDDAALGARPGGYFFAAWNRGYQAVGKFIELEPNKKLVLNLRGSDEITDGQVEIALQEQDGATTVTVNHNNSGERWKHIWERGVENLQSYLETGYDLRVTRRPLMGIAPNELDEETAARIGVPVTRGIQITALLPNMSAEKSGLLVNDVIVELDGKPLTDRVSLVNAVGDHHAGDVIDVAYHRGAEKKHIQLTFSPRPVVPIPATAQEYAEALEKLHVELDAEIRKVFEGVTEEEATRRPEPKEWSARETVIHLLLLQRWFVSMIASRMAGQEFADVAANHLDVIGALAAAFSSTQEALNELKRSRDETLALIRAMSDEFVARRGAFGFIVAQLNEVRDHDREHFQQIRKAIEAAREPVTVAGD